jgi:hypothetical protein
VILIGEPLLQYYLYIADLTRHATSYFAYDVHGSHIACIGSDCCAGFDIYKLLV